MTILNNSPKLRFPEFEGEWEKYNLGEIASFSKGKGISKAEISEDGVTECIRYGELYTIYSETINVVKSKTNINKKNLVLSEANDVIIPASGETQIDIATASCVLKSGIALGGDLNIIKTKNDGVFLSYYLNSKKKLDIACLAQGISVVHLYSSQLSLLSLNLPTLPEQTKIANFLTAVDDKLSQLKKKKSLLEEYKKGVMQGIFNQCLNYDLNDEMKTMINTDSKGNHSQSNNQKNHSLRLRFKDDNGEEFKEWEEKTVGEIVEFRNGKAHENDIDENGKYTVVNSKFISQNGKIRKYSNECIAPLYKNEIVMVMSDVPNGKALAKCFLIDENNKYTLNQRICSLSAKQCYNPFLIYLINRNIYYLSFDSGVGQTNLKKEDVLNCPIILPSSIYEQTKIANFLSAIDDKINQCGVQIEKMEEWKKGLLQRMFV